MFVKIVFIYTFMLAIERSTGVALEVNLEIPLHTDYETWKQGILSGFKTNSICERVPVSSSQYQMPQGTSQYHSVIDVTGYQSVAVSTRWDRILVSTSQYQSVPDVTRF